MTDNNQNAAFLPALVVTPRRPALLADHDNTLEVLVRLQAPDAPPDQPQRNPLHLSLVIDRSGSMSGRPLAEARHCAEFVLDGLTATDRLSLVVYDDGIETLLPAVPVAENREVIRHAIRQIASGGSTNLHGGWLQGLDTLRPHVSAQSVSRVILLSDGCANAGLVEPQAIWAQCAEAAAAGIGTSTYGLGSSFNEDLMIGMARSGHGASYYGESAADLMDPFREEFDLLNALCARRLQLEVEPAPGVKVTMLNAYVAAAPNAWAMPDLAYGGEAWALLRLKVPQRVLAAAGVDGAAVALGTIAWRYTGIDGEPRAIQPQALSLPVLPAVAFGAISEDELVLRRIGELEAAELQVKARRAAMAGDWDTVMRLLRKAERLGGDNPWIAAVVAELRKLAERRDEAVFAKASAYGSHRMHSRLAVRDEERALDAARPAATYLRRKSHQGRAEGPDPSSASPRD
jgi:Ca-activated chloride channel family protein